jgi:hypothetical protein
MPTYHQKVDDVVIGLKGIEPFASVWNRINVYRIDVHSVDAGCDDPATAPCNGTGTTARTYFDATLCGEGRTRRNIGVNNTLVLSTVNGLVQDWEAIVVLVNTTDHGGGALGQVTALSVAGDVVSVIAHEIGHVLGLGEEYDYDGANQWPHGDPREPNATAETDRSKLKWVHLLAVPDQPIPTMNNATGCATPDIRPSAYPPGTVGLFEGAMAHRCKIYRSEHDCAMRSIGAPFCKRCQEAIKAAIIARSARPGTDCFVSAIVYGDTHHPDVVTLRSWRDRHLAEGSVAVRALDAIYRRAGPPLARALVDRPRLARTLRAAVFRPLVHGVRRGT